MKKLFKFQFPFGWNRGSIRALFTLINLSLFCIIIIADLVAYFLNKDLTHLIILTLLLGCLVSCSLGFYFGQRMYQDTEKPVKQYRAKPEVRSVEHAITDEEGEKIVRERFE